MTANEELRDRLSTLLDALHYQRTLIDQAIEKTEDALRAATVAVVNERKGKG